MRGELMKGFVGNEENFELDYLLYGSQWRF